eukprot:533762_1
MGASSSATSEIQSDEKICDNFVNYTEFHQNHREENITVCVTGASGFIASHCVKLLLSKGYNVNGTIRGNSSDDKYKWLYELEYSDKSHYKSDNEYGILKLFKADLTIPNSFDEAIQNIDYLLHIASPVKLNVDDYKTDMLEPAKYGTLNVLNSCLKYKSKLKRVVLTSSLYAVYGIPKKGHVYNESDWNNEFTLQTQPYAYSKTVAEQESWKWMNKYKNNISFDLITILPGLVIGKQLNKNSRFTSSNVAVYNLLKGRFGRLNAAVPITDVRDCAAAHIFFIENQIEANGRYIINAETILLSKIREYIITYCKYKNINTPSLYDSYCKQCCKCDYYLCGICCMPCIKCCCIPKYQRFIPDNINKGINIINNDKIQLLGFKCRKSKIALYGLFDYFLE